MGRPDTNVDLDRGLSRTCLACEAFESRLGMFLPNAKNQESVNNVLRAQDMI